MRQNATSKLVPLFFIVLTLVFGLDTQSQGQDFEVFYRACLHFIKLEPIYDLARDGGMVFKYPPWIVWFYLPFLILPVSLAKFCLGALHAPVLYYLFQKIKEFEVSTVKRLLLLLTFWSIWITHVLDGQISLFILFLCVLLPPQKSLSNWVFHLYTLSFKVFSIFPMVFTKKPKTREIFTGILILILVIVALYVAQIPEGGVVLLLKKWVVAASSGSELLSIGKTRGRENQSITALFLRLFPELFRYPNIEAYCAVGFGLVFFTAWKRVSRSLNATIIWYGYLSLIPVIHPLAWVHLFVFSFPIIAAVVLSVWSSSGHHKTKVYTAALMVLYILNTNHIFGQLGELLQLYSSRSLVILAILGLSVKNESS